MDYPPNGPPHGVPSAQEEAEQDRERCSQCARLTWAEDIEPGPDGKLWCVDCQRLWDCTNNWLPGEGEA